MDNALATITAKEPAMTTLHTRTARRLAAAAAAATSTLAIFSAVVSISEPQRSTLLAKSRPAASAPVAVAATPAVRVAAAAPLDTTTTAPNQ